MNRLNWKELLKNAGRALKSGLSHNLGLKLLSVLFALILWSFVITANPNITRNKTLSGVDVVINGQSILTARGLAMLTDVSSELSSATVVVNAPQASYALVNTANVRVELDLTSIRSVGKQRVNLSGTSVYGDVIQIWPEYIDLDIETRDQREIPVNTQLLNADTGSYWYSLSANPTLVTISGPASVVQTVSSAVVSIDASDIESSQSRAEQYALFTSQGEEVTAPLTRSTSSVTVSIEVYPSKTVPIASSAEDILSGEVPAGYQITSVTVSPDTAVIAAEQSLLDSINELTFSKIDVTNRTASFTRTLNLSVLNGLRYMSTDQATVNVTISETEITRRFQDIPVALVGKPENLSVAEAPEPITVVLTGLYSQVQELTAEDLIATVDLSSLTAGEYELPISVTVDSMPSLVCAPTPSTVLIELE